MPNHLINENSPYLLQHAHNPVDWYPWGEEALSKAKAEHKPIFLSIGYAACHWCHVMAHESFEDPETAGLMNESFINIKVDREERPDLDSIYMQATVAMTGSGGWPMSIFLSPDLKPFYTGTYFPPVRRYNMPSFKEILTSLSQAWMADKVEVEKVGEKVSQHLQLQAQNMSTSTGVDQANELLNKESLEAAAKTLLDSYDWGYGGWGTAPKFPQAMAVEFLLTHLLLDTETKEIKANQIKLIKHCLEAMSRGGMYDVVGGGFARYSTDNFWRVPHFEKMLYDNALLARAYLHAWKVTGEPAYKRVVIETLDFVTREMTHPEGGFYSSLDADSEGEEGKFYVWNLEEIRNILRDDSEFFETAYGISPRGNWEGKNVLQRAMDDSSLAARFKLDPQTVPAKLADSHSRLLTARASRVRPGTDDKVLTAWNGLMLATFAEAARYLDVDAVTVESTNADLSPRSRNSYLEVATRSANFLLSKLRPNGQLRRSWRDGKTTNEVFLEDYAALILGLLELYQTDFNNNWFVTARDLADEMIERFRNPSGGFFDTPNDGESLLLRPKDLQDNATPSGNALACEALIKLALFSDNGEYRDIAEKSLRLVSETSMRYPTAFARWLSVAEIALNNGRQVAVPGDAQEDIFQRMIQVIRSEYRPDVVVAASPYPPEKNSPALLNDRPLIDNKPTAYVCKGFVCDMPTNDPEVLKKQLEQLTLE